MAPQVEQAYVSGHMPPLLPLLEWPLLSFRGRNSLIRMTQSDQSAMQSPDGRSSLRLLVVHQSGRDF